LRVGYYGSSDSCQAERCTRQVSLLHESNLPTIPSPTTPRRPEDQFWFESSGLPSYEAVRPGTPLEQVSLDVSWASPVPSRLATTTGRIEFVILRTSRAPPDALHLPSRERSFVQLQGAESPWQGLAPCRFDPLANALGRALRDRHPPGPPPTDELPIRATPLPPRRAATVVRPRRPQQATPEITGKNCPQKVIRLRPQICHPL
jgi:hypothetical protein